MKYQPWIYKTVKQPEDIKLHQNHSITTPSGYPGLFTREECQMMLQTSQMVDERDAMTSDGLEVRSSGHRISKVRDIFPHEKTSWIFERLEKILIEMNKQYLFDVRGFFEGSQVYKYPTGGYLDWHMDIAKGIMSTRKLSMTIQLNDDSDYEGGNLEFFDYKGKAAPRGIGDLTVFPAYMMHRVSEVTKGERFSWVSWVHGPPFS